MPKFDRPLKKDFSAIKDEIEAYRLAWRENYALREMIAKALDRNQVNAPDQFTEKLNPYRDPPRPTLK